jgi:hypothetical protein
MSRTKNIIDLMRMMQASAGETYFALRDGVVAGIEDLEAELAAAQADHAYAIRMFDQKEAACLKALEERDSAVARLRYLYDDTMSKLIWHDKPPISFDQYAFNIDAARKEEGK